MVKNTTALEKDIQSTICDYLAIKQKKGQLFFYRNNNMPVFDTRRNTFRKMPKHTPSGLPDIVVVKNGFYIALEVKRIGTKQSKEQKECERLIKEVGCAEYYVVRSLDDVINLCNL